MKRFLFLACCLIGLSASAQDLTGIWRGNFNQNNGRPMSLLDQSNRYKFEVQLSQDAKTFEGVTYSYLTTVFYGKATCKGTVNLNTKKVLLEELKIVEVRMSNASTACIMTLFMQYSKMGDEEFLEGTYTSMNTTDSTNCGRGTVFLRRVTTSDFYKEPFLVKKEKEKSLEPKSKVGEKTDTALVKKTPETKPIVKKANTPPASTKKPVTTTARTKVVTKPPVSKPQVSKPPVSKVTVKEKDPVSTLVPGPEKKKIDTPKKVEWKPATPVTPPKVLLTRENELVKTIVTSSNEIIVNIYDNGYIDNDTVSVYLDKKLVLSKKRLTDKALTLKFNLSDDANFHELVMVAENLGELPPNTSLMIVHAGDKQYEVRITSTEQKNAVVIFKYEKNR